MAKLQSLPLKVRDVASPIHQAEDAMSSSGKRPTVESLKVVANLLQAQLDLGQAAINFDSNDGVSRMRLHMAAASFQVQFGKPGLEYTPALVVESAASFRRRVAFHEAGHAVVATCLGVLVARVALDGHKFLKNTRSAGGAFMAPPPPKPTLKVARNRAAISFSGFEAEARLDEALTISGWESDLDEASRVLQSTQKIIDLDDELARSKDRAAKLVRQHWAAISAVADLLSKAGDLDARTLVKVVSRVEGGVPRLKYGA